VTQMVYKHAISTVVPSRNVRVGTNSDESVAAGASDTMPGADA